jgi:universal stress protein A
MAPGPSALPRRPAAPPGRAALLRWTIAGTDRTRAASRGRGGDAARIELRRPGQRRATGAAGAAPRNRRGRHRGARIECANDRSGTSTSQPAVYESCWFCDLAWFMKVPVVMNLPRNIFVPIDLGDHAKQVLDYAFALAGKLDAKVHIFHAVDWPLLGAEIPATASERAMDELVAQRKQDLDQLATPYGSKAPLGSVELEIGDPRTLIAQAAAKLGVDLIVMGTHGRRGVSRLLLGSVAEQVARTAPCPVLLVRSGAAAAR